MLFAGKPKTHMPPTWVYCYVLSKCSFSNLCCCLLLPHFGALLHHSTIFFLWFSPSSSQRLPLTNNPCFLDPHNLMFQKSPIPPNQEINPHYGILSMTRHTKWKGRDANTHLAFNISPLHALGRVFLNTILSDVPSYATSSWEKSSSNVINSPCIRSFGYPSWS